MSCADCIYGCLAGRHVALVICARGGEVYRCAGPPSTGVILQRLLMWALILGGSHDGSHDWSHD